MTESNDIFWMCIWFLYFTIGIAASSLRIYILYISLLKEREDNREFLQQVQDRQVNNSKNRKPGNVILTMQPQEFVEKEENTHKVGLMQSDESIKKGENVEMEQVVVDTNQENSTDEQEDSTASVTSDESVIEMQKDSISINNSFQKMNMYTNNSMQFYAQNLVTGRDELRKRLEHEERSKAARAELCLYNQRFWANKLEKNK